MIETVLNQINLPILIWKKSGDSPLVCDFTNQKVTGIEQNDQLSRHHSNIEEKLGKTGYTYRLKDETVCFSSLPGEKGAKYLEIRYPVVNNYYLLSAISKKLRESLTDIIGILSLLDQLPNDEQSKYFVPIIQQSSYNFFCLANDIVDLIGIDNKTVKLKQERFVLQELIEQCSGTFQEECQEKNVQLLKRIDSNTPTIITGDRGRLQQIIINLLKNAVYSTNEGSIQLSVSLKQAALVFRIKDTGVGLSKETKKIVNHILDNCQCSCHLRHEGFGLFIANRLAELMKARISYRSKLDIGSVFYLSLETF
jgi:signal transduction histidine kinase